MFELAFRDTWTSEYKYLVCVMYTVIVTRICKQLWHLLIDFHVSITGNMEVNSFENSEGIISVTDM
jgi:hypothetical protein